MIRNYITLSFLFFLLCFYGSSAFAQCEDCTDANGSKGDFCFSNPEISGYCVCFYAEKNEVLIHSTAGKKKTSHTLALPTEDQSINTWLIGLSGDKKLKLTIPEALLLQESIPNWNREKRTIGMKETASGLKYKIIKEGTGKLPEISKNVSVHYIGTLTDGTEFDNSVKRGQPISFPLGMGRVIKGWDEGIALLKVGSKAILCIPPALGYGSRGAPPVIPPDATLFFEVELVNAD